MGPVTHPPIQEPLLPMRISVGPPHVSVAPPCVSVGPPHVSVAPLHVSVGPPHVSIGPPHVSVGVSTEPRPLVSKGVSVAFEELLPLDIAAYFNTQMETQVPAAPACPPTQLSEDISSVTESDSQACPPVRLSEEVISVTESDSEPERPLLIARARFRSPEIVPETQQDSDEDFMVRLPSLSRIYSLIQLFSLSGGP